jgi:hypothetical protein
MSMRIVDYHLQTVKIDLNYTLLQYDNGIISYLCRCYLLIAALMFFE